MKAAVSPSDLKGPARKPSRSSPLRTLCKALCCTSVLLLLAFGGLVANSVIALLREASIEPLSIDVGTSKAPLSATLSLGAHVHLPSGHSVHVDTASCKLQTHSRINMMDAHEFASVELAAPTDASGDGDGFVGAEATLSFKEVDALREVIVRRAQATLRCEGAGHVKVGFARIPLRLLLGVDPVSSSSTEAESTHVALEAGAIAIHVHRVYNVLTGVYEGLDALAASPLPPLSLNTTGWDGGYEEGNAWLRTNTHPFGAKAPIGEIALRSDLSSAVLGLVAVDLPPAAALTSKIAALVPSLTRFNVDRKVLSLGVGLAATVVGDLGAEIPAMEGTPDGFEAFVRNWWNSIRGLASHLTLHASPAANVNMINVLDLPKSATVEFRLACDQTEDNKACSLWPSLLREHAAKAAAANGRAIPSHLLDTTAPTPVHHNGAFLHHKGEAARIELTCTSKGESLLNAALDATVGMSHNAAMAVTTKRDDKSNTVSHRIDVRAHTPHAAPRPARSPSLLPFISRMQIHTHASPPSPPPPSTTARCRREERLHLGDHLRRERQLRRLPPHQRLPPLPLVGRGQGARDQGLRQRRQGLG